MKKILSAAVAALLTSTLAVVLNGSPAVAGTRYQVTAYVSSSSLTLGQRVVIKGKVSPAAAGERVTVQVRTPGSTTWRNLKTAVLNGRSVYSTAVVPGRAGDFSYRVLKPRSHGHPAGVSVARAVTVWRWRSLASMPQVAPATGTTVEASVVLGTNTYRPALRQGNGGSVLYVLAGKCARLDAYAGAHPGSTNSGPFVQHIFGSRASSPNTYDQLVAENRVIVGNDPNHILRGTATMLPLHAIEISSNGFVPNDNPNDATVLAGARVYCKS